MVERKLIADFLKMDQKSSGTNNIGSDSMHPGIEYVQNYGDSVHEKWDDG